ALLFTNAVALSNLHSFPTRRSSDLCPDRSGSTQSVMTTSGLCFSNSSTPLWPLVAKRSLYPFSNSGSSTSFRATGESSMMSTLNLSSAGDICSSRQILFECEFGKDNSNRLANLSDHLSPSVSITYRKASLRAQFFAGLKMSRRQTVVCNQAKTNNVPKRGNRRGGLQLFIFC